MKYKAIVSFVGKVTMAQDEIKEIDDEEVINDLLNAGYIAPAKEEKKEIKEVKTEGVVEDATPSKTKVKKIK